MATLGGVTIAEPDSAGNSGGAFLLDQKCFDSACVKLDDGCEVLVHSGSPYVVVRLAKASSRDDVFEKSYESAQRGLDLISIRGQGQFSTKNAHDDCILWWPEQSVQVLRIVSVSSIQYRTGPVSIVSLNRDGREIPAEPTPDPVWREAFRYFRLSQVTDDLLDAFRNMYLAFEAALERVPEDRKGQRNKNWIQKALTDLGENHALAEICNVTEDTAIAHFVESIYVRRRHPLFHAQRGQRILPGDITKKAEIAKGLDILTKTVLLIVQKYCGVGFRSAFLNVFDYWTSNLSSNVEMLVSDSQEPFKRGTHEIIPPTRMLSVPTQSSIVGTSKIGAAF